MPTRRRFIVTALAFGAATAVARSRAAAAATPAPTTHAPTPTPTASPPSRNSRTIAAVLRDAFPEARLTDAEVAKIAEDVDGITPLSKYYRGVHLRNADEPDVVFSA